MSELITGAKAEDTLGGETARSPRAPLWQVELHVRWRLEGLEEKKFSPTERKLSEEAISSLIENLREERELLVEGLVYFEEGGKLSRPTYGDFLEERDSIIKRLQSKKDKSAPQTAHLD